MMSSLSLFCDECGAANSEQATTCFACNQPLHFTSPAPVLITQPPVTPASISNTSIVAPAQTITGPLPAGFVLASRYVIEEQIGQGGFAVVYKARDRKDKRVAIKQINLHAMSAQEMIDATDTFNREVMLLSRLQFSHLPRIRDHFTDPGHWYLVMDFIEGQTLEEYLNTAATRPTRHLFGLLPANKQGTQHLQGLPVKEVLNIGIQLCTVLNYLHTRQPPVIFRDLKPANIMRTPKGRLYLIDFGIARQFNPSQRRDTGALGSPGYAAPEQYGRAQTTARSDLYSLGATLQTLLTGHEPLDQATTSANSPASITPKKLQRLLDQLLEIDPDKRPSSAAAVKRKLLHIRDGFKGPMLNFSAGVLLGSIPYPFLVLLHFTGFGSSLVIRGLLYTLAYALLCSWPLFGLAQATTAIILLLKHRFALALGIIAMLLLVITLLVKLGTLPLMPGFW